MADFRSLRSAKAILPALMTPILALVLLSTAQAQVTTSTILGKVTDPSGAAVPQAKINVQNVGTGIARSATTDTSGNFTVADLPPGQYTVQAEHAGFALWQPPSIQLAVGDQLNLDVHLQIVGVAQQVQVTDITPALHTQNAEMGTLVNDVAVADLPLNGRNFIQLSQVAEGATAGLQNATTTGNRPDDRRNTSAVAVDGLPNNNFLIDGIDDNEREIITIMIKPSEDMIAQFVVLSNNYSAEFSRSNGAVVNLITKSGTNRFHGDLFEFFDNDKLDATNFFVNAAGQSKPERRQNDWGGSLGGPIHKDKAFFFGDFEQVDLRNGTTYVSTVPTLAEDSGVFTGVNAIFDPMSLVTSPSGTNTRTEFPGNVIPPTRINPVAQRFVDLYPAPTSSGFANNFAWSPAFKQRDSKFDMRFDEQLTNSTSMYGRYSFENVSSFLPAQLPNVAIPGMTVSAGGDSSNYAGNTRQQYQQGQIHVTHTFTPTLIAEADVAYTRGNTLTTPVDYGQNASTALGLNGINFDQWSTGFPQISVAGYRGVGGEGALPLWDVDNAYLLKGDVGLNRGRHNIKIGGQIIDRQVVSAQSDSRTGSFSFNANFTNDPSGATPGSGNSVASFLLNDPASTARVAQLIVPFHLTDEYSAFVQDDWRVTDRLTLNLGLRYDVFTPYRDRYNNLSQPDMNTGTFWIAGQNGVSNTVNVQTYYGDIQPRFGFALRLRPRLVLRGGYGFIYMPTTGGSSSEMRNPPYTSTLSIAPTAITPINSFSDGLPPPTPTSTISPTGILYWNEPNLKDQRVEQMNTTLEYEFLPGWVLSTSGVGALGRHIRFSYNMNTPPPGPGALNPRRPFYALFPNVTTITTLVGASNLDNFAWQNRVEHRFKNGLNFIGTYTWAHAISNATTAGCGCAANGPIQQITNWKLERGNSDLDLRNRATAMVNYQLPIARSAKGIEGFVAKGWELSSIVSLQSGMPLTISNSTALANTGAGDKPNRICDGQTPPTGQTIHHFFDTSCFVSQPVNTIGNSGRNILHGPDLQNVDFSMSKEFGLPGWEQSRLRFRSEFFNLSNRANFGIPNATLGSPAFASISDTANSTPRRIQFSLELRF